MKSTKRDPADASRGKEREPDGELFLNRGLPNQAADLINRCIAAGRWSEWLPGERRLAKELQISRGSLRGALEILKHREVIESSGGLGNRILSASVPRTPQRRGLIGVLAPEPLEIFRPYFAVRFDHLQKLAALRGWELRRVNGAAYFGARAASFLARLVVETPCACWVLMHSNRRVQRWFEHAKIPCVISGSAFPGVSLPAADADYRASGRHAAGHLLRLGHRDIGLLISREKGQGFVEGEAGFVEACIAHGEPRVRPVTLIHDNSVAGITNVLMRQFALKPRLTALVVETSNQYLAAITVLMRLGLHVPRDVSLISRVSDPFLDYVVPRPCRYEVDPRRSAEVIVRLVSRRLNGTLRRDETVSLMPTFIRGDSTARPPA